MTKLHIHHLRLSWATSKGRDTYGYNIARLDDSISGKRFRCMGGGYDMIGTVFGDWLEDTYQDDLIAWVGRNSEKMHRANYAVDGYWCTQELYGLTLRPNGSVSLDGACGIESMIRIAESLNLTVQWEGNRKGQTVGYFVSYEYEG